MINKLELREVNQYSPLSLAFMGDSVYELMVREQLMLIANMPAAKLHNLAVKRVCAEYQATAVRIMLEESFLTEDEQEIIRRGRNANGITAPKHSTIGEYRMATALECLFGHLHLRGETQRIEEIFEFVWKIGNVSETAEE